MHSLINETNDSDESLLLKYSFDGPYYVRCGDIRIQQVVRKMILAERWYRIDDFCLFVKECNSGNDKNPINDI